MTPRPESFAGSAARNTIDHGQAATLIVAGASLWFLAALLMRAIEPLGAFKGGVALLYTLIVPGTVPAIMMVRRLARLHGDQTALGVTIATGTAALLDGCALAMIPDLYGTNAAGAGAAILWGAGAALVLGVLMNRSDRS